jgi:hypothetical protein
MKRSVLLNFFLLICFSQAYSQEPTIGAIRWDAWTGSSNGVGIQIEKSLGPNQFHYRVPFFGVEVNSDSVTIDGTTQSIMDQEIDYAVHAGLDYWAFLWYSPASGLDQARNLYKSSSKKHLINYCLIIEQARFQNEVFIDEVVQEFGNSTYMKVMNNRPLLYFLGYSGISVSDIDTLRARSIRSGYGDPYIVMMRVDNNLNTLVDLHMDAFSMYAVTWLSGGIPYSQLVTTEIGQWDYIGKSSNKKFVPHVTTGWDKRTRYLNNVNWETAPSPNDWVQMPTPSELADHILNGVNWVKDNPVQAEANTVLVYAWNEHDEGGWLCPTLDQYGGTERIDTLRAKLNITTEPTPIKNSAVRSSLTQNPLLITGLGSEGWQITNLHGIVILKGNASEVSLSDLQPGVYFIKTRSGAAKVVNY